MGLSSKIFTSFAVANLHSMRSKDFFDGDVSKLSLVNTHTIRVRYGETDAMGYVYYGNYGLYFEVGRNECMRALGFAYGRLEDEGIMMPVAEMHLHYRTPAHYDDILDITTGVVELGGASMIFGYRIERREGAELIVYGQTNMAFVDSVTRKPVRVPKRLKMLLESTLK